MTIAFDYFYAPQASGEVLGINVATDDLLRAWFRYGATDKFVCRAADIQSFEHFKSIATSAGIAGDKCIGLDPHTPQHNLESISCLFHIDPAFADSAWRRQQLQGKGYTACGVVHSLSGEQVSRAVTDLCIAPTMASDALICPSTAIRDAVQNLWGTYTDYLNHRFGSRFHCPIQTPVIPLGIDTEKFTKRTTADKRRSQRQILNIADDEIIILFVGRLSFATKAHPLPLLLAAEQAAKTTKKKLRLILNGYFKPQQEMEPRYRDLAKDICQTVRCDFIMHDDPRFPDGLWAAADIFTSLVENVQESFGLTPIEAMASGLPVVITDWDGYRDAVQHGAEGFLIPTCAPPASAGKEIANFYFNHKNYGTYLVGASQSTSVDIQATARAFIDLAENDSLRSSLSQKARHKAQSTYDWRHIITAYEKLWSELATQRQSGKSNLTVPPNWSPNHPSFPNPWKIFASFPSSHLGLEDSLKVVMTNAEIMLILKHDMNLFIPELLLPTDALRELIETIRRAGSAHVRNLLAPYSPADQSRLWRSFGWLMKHGICTREAA